MSTCRICRILRRCLVVLSAVMLLKGVYATFPSDMISRLPGQPPEGDASLRQYSGYVTVDERAGRAFFYYFVEATEGESASKPLTLWLNGGPRCSSVGIGAFQEIGPLHPTKANRLVINENAWSRATNLLFVESPAGVGFSYSNTTNNYLHEDDNKTARDNLLFLLSWLEKFPEYKGREFYIAGESYAGHYIPQLATLIQKYMYSFGKSTLNLKAIAIGNPALDDLKDITSTFSYLWSHGVISDETYEAITRTCNWNHESLSSSCIAALTKASHEEFFVSPYDVTADVCVDANNLQANTLRNTLRKKVKGFSQQQPDPCIDLKVTAYLNRPDVQAALHANSTKLHYPWSECSRVLHYRPSQEKSMLPLLEGLLLGGIRVLVYSGDQDSVVPFIGTRTLIDELAIKLGWNTTITYKAWYHDNQVAGWTQAYGSQLTYATVRGAGHEVPSTNPAQSLALFKAFLAGNSLPITPPRMN